MTAASTEGAPLVGVTRMRSSRANEPGDNVRSTLTRAGVLEMLCADPVVLKVKPGASRQKLQDAKRDQLTAYSLATYRGDMRSIANVEQVYAIGLDLDDPSLCVSLDTACGMLPFAGIVLTSATHTAEAPRLRAHVWTSRPVTADEYSVCWEYLKTTVEDMGIGVGKSARDPSRIWYSPSRVPWGAYECRAVGGPDLDVDAVIASAVERSAPRSQRPPKFSVHQGGKSRASDVERFRAWVAKADPSIDGEGGSDKTLTVACKIVRVVRDASAHMMLLEEYSRTCVPPWSEKELEHKLKAANTKASYEGWGDREPRTGTRERISDAPPAPAVELIEVNGAPAKIPANVMRMLATHPRGAPRLNLLARRVEWPDGSPNTDSDEVHVQGWLAAQPFSARVMVGLEAVHAGIRACAEQRPFHPVRDYLAGLTWDGTSRLESFAADCLGATDTELVRNYMRCFFVGAVARAMSPGCQNDVVLVLEGVQGARKTSALRALFGAKWFGNTPINVKKTPDCYQALEGFWGYELAEIDAYSKTEAGAVKGFVSAREDTYRPSYGRNTSTYERQVAFTATTNAETWANDATGGRRYQCVKCTSVDLVRIVADRDQLWAEAAHRYAAGETWWLDRTMETAAAEDIDSRYQGDPWDNVLPFILRNHMSITSSAALLLLGVELGRQTRGDEMRVGYALRRIGWSRQRTQHLGVRGYEYVKTLPKVGLAAKVGLSE